MKISKIELSWFRGAAHDAALQTNDRSLTVYGANGSGKSCFVDAIEYTLRGGRIGHLAHEYSGKHQEKAVLNTHRPPGASATIRIGLANKSAVQITIAPNGTADIHLEGDSDFTRLDCTRTVLRQDEVSYFIHSTKGEKYSVLLPLLGLGHLETKAENFRQLAKALVKQSGSREAATSLRSAQAQFERVYADVETPDSAVTALTALCHQFVEAGHDHRAATCADLVEAELEARLKDVSTLERQQVELQRLGSMDLRSAIDHTRSAATALAQAADAAVQYRLDALRATKAYLADRTGDDPVVCPSCGSEVPRSEFTVHVEEELVRLEDVEQRRTEYRGRVRETLELARRVVQGCRVSEVESWASASQDARIESVIADAAKVEIPTDALSGDDLTKFEQDLLPAVRAAAAGASFLPPGAADLAHAKERLSAARSLHEAEKRVAESAKGEQIARAVRDIEAEIRAEIQSRSESIIADISADIQRMWHILHPGEPIEDVRLHIPQGSDKAIDIALKFYGKELESPRLTLSEGYRNSLGLCVFLAMAVRSGNGEAPIVLDDVIVSLDRGHRGMVADLLREEFSERQILLFTHDRDWYADLRQQLSGKEWSFRSLLPYQNPEDGIRWSHMTATMDDARAYLESRPDTAANEARKTMDIELAIHAERLDIELPYARGARNDRRTSHEFLQALIREGKTRFQKRDESGKYVVHEEAVDAFEAADRLLITWANRGSHTHDVEKTEATKLIEVCATALEQFRCAECEKPVTFAETKQGRRQCQCSSLRWK